jgi:hypothetical protein
MSADVANRRLDDRVTVIWNATCQLGGRFAQGSILDVSSGGVFFTAAKNGDPAYEARAEKHLEFATPGDTLMLRYQPDWRAEPVTVLAKVQWKGFSREHEVTGTGLQFDNE